MKFQHSIPLLLLAFTFSLLIGCDKNTTPESQVMEEIAAQEAEPVQQPEGPNFALISPNHPVYVGEKNQVTLEIEPKNGLKINHEFPWKVKFMSKNNLVVDEQILGPEQFEMSDKKVKIKLDVTPSNEGTLDLEGVGTFSVCSLKLCDIRRDEPLHFTLVAEPKA